MTDPILATPVVAPSTPAAPGLKAIGSALLRTIYESVDSKKSTTGLVGAVAAIIALVAGRQGWTWLTPETADMIAGVIVVKGLAVIGSHMVVDKAKAEAQGPQAPLSQAPDAPRPLEAAPPVRVG